MLLSDRRSTTGLEAAATVLARFRRGGEGRGGDEGREGEAVCIEKQELVQSSSASTMALVGDLFYP